MRNIHIMSFCRSIVVFLPAPICVDKVCLIYTLCCFLYISLCGIQNVLLSVDIQFAVLFVDVSRAGGCGPGWALVSALCKVARFVARRRVGEEVASLAAIASMVENYSISNQQTLHHIVSFLRQTP